jgi:4-amino-4-deoxy-L-arabinose transferase-like glycosyltransferase
LVACFFLFFYKIGARDLWSPDEPRYAQVAREMLETGEWVVPHLNGNVYTEKPPLYFWLIALLSKPFDNVGEVTARFPSALCATLVVLLTFFLGRKIFGIQEAFWGALVMATSAQFVTIGRTGALDMLLTLSILGAMTLFYLAYTNDRAPLFVAGFPLLIPGVLTKGPVAIALPLVVMLVFLVTDVCIGKKGAKKRLAWFALSTALGLAVVVLVIVPWWHAAYERSGGVYGSPSILAKQTGGRMLNSYSHQRPFHYYFGEILWQFLPWVVFFPLTAHAIWKKGRLRDNDGLRFLFIWFLGVFLFFSCISGKRSQYLLPLLPAGGLIIGWALCLSNPSERKLSERREYYLPLLLLSLISAGGLVYVSVASYFKAPDHFILAVLASVVAILMLAVLGVIFMKRPPATWLSWIAVITVLVVTVVFGYAGPIMDKHVSAQPFCDKVLAALEEDDGLFFYGFYKPNIHFYMRRQIPNLQFNINVNEALKAYPRLFLILQWKEKDTLDLGIVTHGYRIEEFVRTRIGSRDIVCVIVYPPDSPG